MKRNDLLNAKFDEYEFRKLVAGLLPDFAEERREIVARKTLRAAERDAMQKTTLGMLQKVRMIGTSEACRLAVIVARAEKASSIRRIAMTQEMFRILRQHRIRNALVAFETGEENWRLSLLTSTLKIKNGKVVGETSNPRRYSYLLGPKAKTQTPRSFLIERGRVADLDELKERFSVEVVNKQFYKAIAGQFAKLVGSEHGGECEERLLAMPAGGEKAAAEFAVRLIGRIIFCWFLKEKQSAAGLSLMPGSLVSTSAVRRHPEYYHNVLEPVFFGCLNTKFEQRMAEMRRAPFSQVPYLNGGLFNPQENDFYESAARVEVDDEWFSELYEILEQYNFTVDENTNLDADLSIDPEMLGRIFENLLAEINPETGESARKATGSFYTPREIVEYMVDESLRGFLWKKTGIAEEKLAQLMNYETKVAFDDNECAKIAEALDNLRILDLACGSGAFPIGILQKVFYIWQRVEAENASETTSASGAGIPESGASGAENNYARKLKIIQQSIFGADIQPIATEIAKLRCFLTLVIEEEVDDMKPNRGIQPLPNLDFKFVTANALKFLPENPNDPFNMFENGKPVEAVRKIRNDYFLADKAGRAFLKVEFGGAQDEIAETEQELAKARYQKLAKWKPFLNRRTDWFASEWMFGVKDFDIVIGNPPYGATLTKTEQEYCMKHYRAARSEEGLQGSLDTFALFIERGLGLLKTGGSLAYIVPMAITSNDAMTALQNELEQKCATMRIATFMNRPRQIFENACVRTAMMFCEKTNTPMQELFMTRPVRRGSEMTIREVIESLEFVEAYKYKLYGRYPKAGNAREVGILEKIFQTGKRVRDYGLREDALSGDSADCGKFYYRAAGGRYFNIVTLEATGTSAEREYRSRHAALIAASLSTSLFWFYQQVYTDGLNLKGYEIEMFPLPDFAKVGAETRAEIEKLYRRYLADIEQNAETKNVAEESRYNVGQFKEYKLVKSKKLIDEMDDLFGPLYGLSEEEIEYVKNYEKNVRMGGETCYNGG